VDWVVAGENPFVRILGGSVPFTSGFWCGKMQRGVAVRKYVLRSESWINGGGRCASIVERYGR
jgi:hypothetical protein